MSSPHHHSKIPVPPLRTPAISQRSAATSMEGDIKSFSHELDYCVQPLPFWKSLPIEEVMGMIRAEFAKVKGEIDGELRGFAGDMDRVIEKSSECGSKDKLLIMLQVAAEESARMSADKLWIWCELTVRMLDARGQELPAGRLKQAFTHLSSLLSRCSRLVRLHKEVVAGARVPRL